MNNLRKKFYQIARNLQRELASFWGFLSFLALCFSDNFLVSVVNPYNLLWRSLLHPLFGWFRCSCRDPFEINLLDIWFPRFYLQKGKRLSEISQYGVNICNP
jgi:hypothetical protein